MRHRTRAHMLAAAASTLACAPFAKANVQVVHQIVARTGEQVPFAEPGLLWGLFFGGLTDATINEAGHVGFMASLSGPGVDSTNSAMLVAGPPGSLRRVARSGEPAPGLPPGVMYFLPSLTMLDGAGRVLFYSGLSGPGITTANDAGVWLESPTPGGQALPVFREGGAAPGLPSLTVAALDVRNIAFGGDGRVAVVLTLGGPGVTTSNDSALFRSVPGAPDTLLPVAPAGAAFPLLSGVTYGGLGGITLAPDGTLLCRVALLGTGITAANDSALVAFAPGSVTPTIIVREGDPIGGTPGGVWGSMLAPSLNTAGELAFYAQNAGTAPASASIWVGPRDGAGAFRASVMPSAQAPDFPAGALVTGVGPTVFAVGHDGRAAFGVITAGGGVTTANDTGLYTEAPGGVGATPRLIAREGQRPPGLAAPNLYGNQAPSLLASVAIDDARHTAFFSIAPGAPGAPEDTGLWIADSAGVVQLIAHRSIPFILAPGDTRTLSSVGYRVLSGPQPAWRTWLTRDGRLILPLHFTDATGALVITHLDPPVACRADFNGVGGVTVQDLFDFLGVWFSLAPAADFNGIGGVTVQDLFDFLGVWFPGCP